MSHDTGHTIESLLENEPWMRGLARGLLQDDAAAADAVQKTFTAALTSPPTTPGAERGWLATVTRNFARQEQRSGASRRTREQAAARPEALPAAAALVEREELRRKVVEAVLELDEPYRSTVLWRFFEDLSPKEIGERTNTPAATVRTRLKRGLDHLRARLDGLHAGERRTWAVMLLPLAGGDVAEAASSASAWWLRGAVAAGVLAAAGWWIVNGAGQTPSRPEALKGDAQPPIVASEGDREPLPPVQVPGAAGTAGAAAAANPIGGPPLASALREVPEFLRGRIENRAGRLAHAGGGAGTEGAAAAGLQWLARHQSKDGSWNSRSFNIVCQNESCDGFGASDDYTTGTTALACLAFLGTGHAPGRGEHEAIVRRGLEWLRSQQREDGAINAHVADGHGMYGHAMATIALCEASALATRGAAQGYTAAGQQAVGYLVSAQNPFLGWRYGLRPGDNDTSVTAWCTQALWVARQLGFTVRDPRRPDREPLDGALNWVKKVTFRTYHKTGYTQKGDNGARLPDAMHYAPNECMTAAGVSIRLAAGQDPAAAAVQGGVRLLANLPPVWDPAKGNDYYYWYWGTHTLSQLRGPLWKPWNDALKTALVAGQRRGGHADGSWDPTSAWGPAGGRVYAPAINVLTLEAYYRYPAAAATEAEPEVLAADRIRGRVLGPRATLAESPTVLLLQATGDTWRKAGSTAVAPDGSWLLTEVPAGAVRVVLQLSEHSRYIRRGPSAADAAGGQTGLEFRLDLAPRVALAVLDAGSGAPIAGIKVWPNAHDVAVGQALVFMQRPKRPVTFSAPGYLSSSVVLTTPESGRADHPEPVRLRRLHRVHGSAEELDGAGVEGGMVVVERLDAPLDGLARYIVGHINRAAQIVVPGLPSGRYRMRLLVKGHPIAIREFEVAGEEVRLTVQLPAGERTAFVPTRKWSEARAEHITVDFTDTAIRDVLKVLERATGVALGSTGDWSPAATQQLRVNLKLEAVSLEDTLSLITSMAGLALDETTGVVSPKKK